MPSATSSGGPRGTRFWIGAAAIALPLVVLLALQLRTLAELRDTSVVAERATLRSYAKAVLRDVEEFYEEKARSALDLPPALFVAPRADALAAHFASRDGLGVKRFFAVAFDGSARPPFWLFAPDGRALDTADVAETRAALVAAAPWQLVAQEGAAVESPAAVASEQFPENRVIARPIVDAGARVLGVAGLIADADFVREHFVPERLVVQSDLLPEPLREAAQFTLRMGPDPPDVAPAPEEVELPFRFVFSDWALAVRGHGIAPEAFARRSLWLNLSLSLAVSAVLASAVLLALRNAARATQLSQMKTEFVSNVSHELRTPLASIRVFGELLRLGRVSDPEKVREYGEYIDLESRRLSRLVDNILDFSKIESGQRRYRFEPLDLAKLVAATLEGFDVRLRQEGFSLVLRAPEEPLPEVLADPSALGQALGNLVDNAIKYSGGAREIRIELGREADAVTLAVSDRGPGIAPEEQARVFEKFYRVSTGLVHDAQGSGLGLAIVKHVVEAHGGSVELASTPGAGSTFRIRLPVHAG
jgi:two-component system phosphate regulon sensor histidine kinase PhoR